MRRIGILGILLLASCRVDTDGPASVSREKLVINLNAALGTPCVIGISNYPTSGGGWVYEYPTRTTNSVCGIRWTMEHTPIDFNQFSNTMWFWNIPAESMMEKFYVTPQYGQRQNGPNLVRFDLPVARFTSEMTLAEIGGGYQGPESQRIVAFDASGAVIIDTVGALTTTLTKVGMSRIAIYPSVKPEQGLGPDTAVFGRTYVLSFSPDSTCPPLNDSILNSKAVRDAMQQLVSMSNAMPVWKETALVIAADSAGTQFYPVFKDQPSATGCTNPIANNLPPMPAGGVSWVALAHTHMMQGGTVTCGGKTGTANNDPTGGLSPADWDLSLSSGAFVYAITTDGFVYRTDKVTPGSAAGKFAFNNPNTWTVGARGCFQK